MFKIAFNLGVISKPGEKPDFGNGIPKELLTAWQRKTRRELTFNMHNVEITPQRIAAIIGEGGTITAWHTGGDECKKSFDVRDGKMVMHQCFSRQHRCNDNF